MESFVFPPCETVVPCDFTYFWNELACECFATKPCRNECDNGQVIDPTSRCECVDESVVDALYPERSSDQMIQLAYDMGYSQLIESGDYMPLDPDDVPMPCGGDDVVIDEDDNGRRQPDRDRLSGDGRRRLCINPELWEDVNTLMGVSNKNSDVDELVDEIKEISENGIYVAESSATLLKNLSGSLFAVASILIMHQ